MRSSPLGKEPEGAAEILSGRARNVLLRVLPLLSPLQKWSLDNWAPYEYLPAHFWGNCVHLRNMDSQPTITIGRFLR